MTYKVKLVAFFSSKHMIPTKIEKNKDVSHKNKQKESFVNHHISIRLTKF